jgi:short-subunit dehydrogenase
MLEGKRMVIPGLFNKVMVQSARLAPRAVLAKVARRLQESFRA